MISLPYVIQSEAKDLENTPRLSKALFTHPLPPLSIGESHPDGFPSREEQGCVRIHKAEKKS